jgi:hypothetical protein
MSKKATMGDVVHAVVDPRMNNGEDVAPAIVTRVKEVEYVSRANKEVDEQYVNLRVLLDTGADQRFTNVQLFDNRPSEDDEDVPLTVEGVQRVAFWPTRS